VLGFVTRSDDVRKSNRRLILSAVRRGAPLSRTDICNRSGLSAATVSAITADLIAEGVLCEHSQTDGLSSVRGGRGRPKTDLNANPAAGIIGTLNLQLNSVSAAIADYSGTPLSESSVQVDTYEASVSAIRQALFRTMREALAACGRNRAELRGIVVAVQGVTDVQGTKLLWSPITKRRNQPIQSWLTHEFGVPVCVCNDCDLMALALNWSDPAAYRENFAAILLAHGVGMGLFLRGKLINGIRTSGAEFGHMVHVPDGALCRCGSFGCIEAYAGDYAIKRRAAGQPDDAPPPGKVLPGELTAIVNAARDGDENARAAIEGAGAALGSGLASIYALVDPFPIALIGCGTVTRDLLEPSIRAAVEQSVAVRNAIDPSGAKADEVRIDFVADGDPLVQRGCIIRALFALDEEFAHAES